MMTEFRARDVKKMMNPACHVHRYAYSQMLRSNGCSYKQILVLKSVNYVYCFCYYFQLVDCVLYLFKCYMYTSTHTHEFCCFCVGLCVSVCVRHT